MIHPDTELRFISQEIGYGVIATAFIPAGTITWVLDELDREFTPTEVQSMSPLYQEILDTYAYRNNKGNLILCWDYAKYVNHSFNSSCLSTAYEFELAIRDINPGEQLTDDYGYLNLSRPFRGSNEGTKRKTVYPNDLRRYYKIWDKKLVEVYGKMLSVEQPLKKLFSEKQWQEVVDISKGKKEAKSILENYYDEEKIAYNGMLPR